MAEISRKDSTHDNEQRSNETGVGGIIPIWIRIPHPIRSVLSTPSRLIIRLAATSVGVARIPRSTTGRPATSRIRIIICPRSRLSPQLLVTRTIKPARAGSWTCSTCGNVMCGSPAEACTVIQRARMWRRKEFVGAIEEAEVLWRGGRVCRVGVIEEGQTVVCIPAELSGNFTLTMGNH